MRLEYDVKKGRQNIFIGLEKTDWKTWIEKRNKKLSGKREEKDKWQLHTYGR